MNKICPICGIPLSTWKDNMDSIILESEDYCRECEMYSYSFEFGYTTEKINGAVTLSYAYDGEGHQVSEHVRNKIIRNARKCLKREIKSKPYNRGISSNSIKLPIDMERVIW